MDSGEIVCNFRKCRKRLDSLAWVTSCSHIFCDEDGTREFEKATKCPACDTNLPGSLDIVKIDLLPSEQYKSMILAGHRPDVIMDICSRAMSFWIYQIHQEIVYQEYLSNKIRDRHNQLEEFYKSSIAKANAEIASLKRNLDSVRRELETQKRRVNELSEKLMDKSRQHQKLQAMYEALRRKCVSPSIFEKMNPLDHHQHHHHHHQLELQPQQHKGHRFLTPFVPMHRTATDVHDSDPCGDRIIDNFTLQPVPMDNNLNNTSMFAVDGDSHLPPTDSKFTLQLPPQDSRTNNPKPHFHHHHQHHTKQ